MKIKIQHIHNYRIILILTMVFLVLYQMYSTDYLSSGIINIGIKKIRLNDDYFNIEKIVCTVGDSSNNNTTGDSLGETSNCKIIKGINILQYITLGLLMVCLIPVFNKIGLIAGISSLVLSGIILVKFDDIILEK